MNECNTIPQYLRVTVGRRYQSLEVELPQELSLANKSLVWRQIAKWRRQKGWKSAIPVYVRGGLCPYTNFCVVYTIPCNEINEYIYGLLKQQQQTVTE